MKYQTTNYKKTEEFELLHVVIEEKRFFSEIFMSKYLTFVGIYLAYLDSYKNTPVILVTEITGFIMSVYSL